VPLDGSPTAEMTIPYVVELATHFDSKIILLSVFEPGAMVTENLFRSYLANVSAKILTEMQKIGTKKPIVDVKINPGNPTSEIMRNADIDGVDLIVMASRGSSVESDWVLGNIAAKIVRIATKPVMLIKQPAKEMNSQHKKLISKILVPLDGSIVGEAAIPHAEVMGQKLGANIVLFHVAEIAPYPRANDFVTKARDENEFTKVSAYLNKTASELRKKGLTVTSELVVGYPAESILNYVETNAIDIIAISTHGRSGVGRWAIGSVTDKLLYAGNIPILVEHSKS